MDLTQLKEYLDNNTNFGALKRTLKKTNPVLLSDIENSWNFDREPASFLEVLYQYLSPTPIVCPYGNNLKFEYFRTGYRCKKGCPCSSEKKAKTMMSRYGVEHALQSEELAEKAQKTWVEKYGVDKLSQINTEQKKKTNLEKHGAEYPLQSSEIQKKISKTNLERYGHSKPFGNNEVQTKATDSVMQKYGVKSVLEIPENKKKASSVVLEKYGVASTFALKQVQEKIRNSIVEKYGVEHVSQRHLDSALLAEFKDAARFTEIYQKFDRVSEIMDYFGIGRSSIHNRARELGLPVKYSAVSEAEQEIADFLSQYTRVEQSNRTIISPKEIDIWLPDLNLGIEYNGVYHHSSKFDVHRLYHINKTEEVESRGSQLIQIFSDEWLYKREIVESRLLNKIGKSRIIVYARKCKVEKISSSVASEFLNKSHIQGSCLSSHNYALTQNDEIVALMTFGSARFTKNAKWELLRFCTAPYTTVVGGASKLLKSFRSENSGSLVSYADRRWSNGNLYKVLGFEFSHNTGPGYSYVKGGKRYSRNKFQKHKLEGLLPYYDSNLSETENMKNNGFYKLYDCGNSVWYLN